MSQKFEVFSELFACIWAKKYYEWNGMLIEYLVICLIFLHSILCYMEDRFFRNIKSEFKRMDFFFSKKDNRSQFICNRKKDIFITNIMVRDWLIIGKQWWWLIGHWEHNQMQIQNLLKLYKLTNARQVGASNLHLQLFALNNIKKCIQVVSLYSYIEVVKENWRSELWSVEFTVLSCHDYQEVTKHL